MGFIKAGGGDIFNNFSHDRTLGTHTHTGTPPTPWRKKLSFMKREPVVAGTSALVLVLVLQLGGR